MKLALALVIALAGVARADAPTPDAPDPLLTALGLGVTNEGPGTQWLFEVAYRPAADLPLRAHVMFAKGSGSFEDYGTPEHWELRGGIETFACGGTGVFCWVLDLDAGMLRQHAADYGSSGGQNVPAIDRSGFLLGGRGGFDAGNRTLRFRLMIDVAGAVSGPFLVHDSMGTKLDLSNVSGLEAEVVMAF